MRLLELPSILRAAGLTVHEYTGWRERGLSTFGPVRGVICHGTAGNIAISVDLRIIAIDGSNTADPPIAQLVVARDGDWWVVASGTCTGVKIGTAGPLKGYGDDAVVQIEAAHAKDEPWSAVQYNSYVRGVAALVAYKTTDYDVSVSRVVGHYEHQPTEKTDPWFDMNIFRARVAAVLSGDDMSWDEPITIIIDGKPVTNTARNWLAGTGDAAWKTYWKVQASEAADASRDAAVLTAIKALADAGGVDAAPIVEAIKTEATTTRTLVEQRHQEEMAALEQLHATQLAERDAELAGLRAELAALTSGTEN